ncbi:MAG: hypothetical protein Q4G24_15070 [Paracoccus sp. (in: a-proteobacteria)]|uniref:hypothetical protein n=1 Tax=Paracoccus sp. TaxID=267 RepID=UPI0026E0FE18|nr:hypothetical protein [Paracoccus sp. (in: a-proteobacteria)]MDO5622774.1 hypothetical protein [Paracoccus sp. (in: a-proteobacteria)]
MSRLDWIEVTKGGQPIGAVGFLDNDAVIVAAFFDDRDSNKDGKVSGGEWVKSKIPLLGEEGSAVTEVAMTARLDLDVIMRDPGFGQMAGQMFAQFGTSLVMEGFWTVYFSRGVKMTARGVAKTLTKNQIKQFVIRKGAEQAVRKAVEAMAGG